MRKILVLGWGLLLGCQSAPQPVADYILEVDSGRFDRVDAVVSVEFEGISGPVHLFEVTQGLRRPTPVQIEVGTPNRLYFVLTDETPRETVRRFELFVGGENSDKSSSKLSMLNEEGKYLELRLSDAPVLRYNYGTVEPPDPSTPKIQARNAYIHPVWTPRGIVVTDDFNPDHLHQRGIWNAWVKTEFEGRHPDFWNLGDGTGTVRFEAFDAQEVGPVFSRLKIRHRHVDLSAPEGEKAVLSEIWTLRLYSVGGKFRGFYLMDLESVQTVVADSPLTLSEYHYGGMAFRGAREWTPDVAWFLTSEGKERIEGDDSRADWIIIGGASEEAAQGTAILSDPENLRSPQPLRIHPEMPYTAFSPVRLGKIELEPGDRIESRYRYIFFDGKPGISEVSPYWSDFVEPPVVTITPNTVN
ncbi:MAG: PmoA family protein [Acidobacteriota bacterium]|nr:MAG: PmoA family protein [Acidobacteriota bacterium]